MAAKVVASVLALTAGVLAENDQGIGCNFYLDPLTETPMAVGKCTEVDYANLDAAYAVRYTCEGTKLMYEIFGSTDCSGSSTEADVSSGMVYDCSFGNECASATLTEMFFSDTKCQEPYLTRVVDVVSDTCMGTNGTMKIKCSSTKNYIEAYVYSDDKCKENEVLVEMALDSCDDDPEVTDASIKSEKREGCRAAHLSAVLALVAALAVAVFA